MGDSSLQKNSIAEFSTDLLRIYYGKYFLNKYLNLFFYI